MCPLMRETCSTDIYTESVPLKRANAAMIYAESVPLKSAPHSEYQPSFEKRCLEDIFLFGCIWIVFR